MLKIYRTIFALLILSTGIFAQLKSDNSFNLEGGLFFMTGDNTENFETGYTAGFGYEHRFTNNFGLEILPTVSYVYLENEIGFFGVYADTYVLGVSLSPKFYIPVGSGGFKLILAPRCSYSYVNNQVEVWIMNYYTNEEKTIKNSYNNGVFSFGGVAGFEVEVSKHFAIGLNVFYDSLDLGEDLGKIDWADDTTYENNIKTSRIGVLSTFKFCL